MAITTKKGTTPIRHVRVPDRHYVPACARALREGTTYSEKVREWTRDYAEGRRD